MEELQSVKLSCERLVQEPDFTTCSKLRELNMRFANPAAICLVGSLTTTLKVLRLTCWNREFPALLELGSMPSLEEVEIVNNLEFSSGSIAIRGFNSLTHLKTLALKKLPIRGSIAGLEALVSLEALLLNKCQALNALPGLGKLTNLQGLDVSSTAIESLAGLENLLQLCGLHLVNCNRLKSLQELQRLVQWTDKSSGPKVDFQRVLCHCPTAAALEQGLYQLQGLEEVSKAFEEAFLMMHIMAAARRTKEEFDPKTDLIICATIVSIIPKYADRNALRMSCKGDGYDFLGRTRYLRGLLKSHQP